jgi:carboxylesterase type B
LEPPRDSQTVLPREKIALVLNVFTPALGDGRKRPVMVWLHGGGFFHRVGLAADPGRYEPGPDRRRGGGEHPTTA